MGLSRWMEHDRRRGNTVRKTGLKKEPKQDAEEIKGDSALNGEIVQVLGDQKQTNGFAYVKLPLSGLEGWMRKDYLHDCSEGTRHHGRLVSGGGRHGKMYDLKPTDSRFKMLQQMIDKTGPGGVCAHPNCPCKGRTITIKSVKFIRNLYLGATGMETGVPTLLFHGCKDAVVQSIAQDGFDDKYCNSFSSFGKGFYFSSQACKAWSYAENHLLVCTVALGNQNRWLDVAATDTSLNYDTLIAQGKRSVHHRAGAVYNHEEFIVYRPTQCRPTYIIETTQTSPGGGK